jgi:uncharacterized protein YndB with AHSA1/START domain
MTRKDESHDGNNGRQHVRRPCPRRHAHIRCAARTCLQDVHRSQAPCAVWGPKGFTTTIREVDTRPGGAFRIDMRGPDGGIYPCKGVYREVVAPERIVYIGGPDGSHACGGGLPPRALVTITFAGHAGKTALTIDTRFEAAADRDAAIKMGFDTGWASSLDRLADLLEKLWPENPPRSAESRSSAGGFQEFRND